MQIIGLVFVVIMALILVGLIALGAYLLVGKLRARREWSNDELYTPSYAPDERYGGAGAAPARRTGYLGPAADRTSAGPSGGVSGVPAPPPRPDYGSGAGGSAGVGSGG